MVANRQAAILVAGLGVMLALGGCQRSVSGLDTRSAASPLPAAPVDQVQSSQLDPAAPTQIAPGGQQVAAMDPTLQQQPLPDPNSTALPGTNPAPAQQQIAAATPSATPSAPVSRESVTGTWIVASDNPECRIILAFTKWSGGYRAATRRCETSELTAVSAWDVKDNKVVLVDANGNQVASLASTGAEQYDGVTSGGKPVKFSR
jgi:hypothetical protein